MQAVLEQNVVATESFVGKTKEAFGEEIGFLASLFGCWHNRLSRPLTVGRASYRACLECGARKQFDAETLKTYGSFHYPPALSFDEN